MHFWLLGKDKDIVNISKVLSPSKPAIFIPFEDYFLKVKKKIFDPLNQNPVYFSKLLPSNQCWRLFPEFRDSTVYLDIETTGLDRHFNEITTIALYDGQAIKTWMILLRTFRNTRSSFLIMAEALMSRLSRTI